MLYCTAFSASSVTRWSVRRTRPEAALPAEGLIVVRLDAAQDGLPLPALRGLHFGDLRLHALHLRVLGRVRGVEIGGLLAELGQLGGEGLKGRAIHEVGQRFRRAAPRHFIARLPRRALGLRLD